MGMGEWLSCVSRLEGDEVDVRWSCSQCPAACSFGWRNSENILVPASLRGAVIKTPAL